MLGRGAQDIVTHLLVEGREAPPPDAVGWTVQLSKQALGPRWAVLGVASGSAALSSEQGGAFSGEIELIHFFGCTTAQSTVGVEACKPLKPHWAQHWDKLADPLHQRP